MMLVVLVIGILVAMTIPGLKETAPRKQVKEGPGASFRRLPASWPRVLPEDGEHSRRQGRHDRKRKDAVVPENM